MKKHFFGNFYFGISEREVPGTWKLETWSSRNLGTSELGNLFKGIPASSALRIVGDIQGSSSHGDFFLMCNMPFILVFEI